MHTYEKWTTLVPITVTVILDIGHCPNRVSETGSVFIMRYLGGGGSSHMMPSMSESSH
jgi:hypothetical protein